MPETILKEALSIVSVPDTILSEVLSLASVAMRIVFALVTLVGLSLMLRIVPHRIREASNALAFMLQHGLTVAKRDVLYRRLYGSLYDEFVESKIGFKHKDTKARRRRNRF